MKTVGEYVTDASVQLNDQQVGREFTRWSRALLVSYLNDALAEIAAHKPEAFAKQVSLDLEPGRIQRIDKALDDDRPGARLVSIDTNKDGSSAYEADFDLTQAFAPFNCCVDPLELDKQGRPIYRVVSYSINPKDTRTFTVSPPVPAGLSAVVRATVMGLVPMYSAQNDFDTVVDAEPKYQAAILDYMVGRAFEIDTESPSSRSNADRHLGRFYTMMGVKYRYESAYRAGNTNGAIGDGDPRSTAP